MISDVKNITFKSFGITDCGLEREENEDAFFLNDEKRIYAVADGLGGLPQGAYASHLAMDILAKFIEDKDYLDDEEMRELFKVINKGVHVAGEKVSQELGIGTTLTVALINNNKMLIGHVGDTGIFLFRNGVCKKLTTDHTMAQEMRSRLAPDEDIYIPDYFTHTLTRCIGQLASLKCDIYTYDIEPGDKFLLFSDGVTKVFDEEELAKALLTDISPDVFVKEIVNIANERGGPDNCTAIALFMD